MPIVGKLVSQIKERGNSVLGLYRKLHVIHTVTVSIRHIIRDVQQTSVAAMHLRTMIMTNSR